MTRAHVAWAALGGLAALSLWFVVLLPGAVLLLATIAMAFVLQRRIGGAQAWIAVATCSLVMAGIMAWAASTDARCPAPGQTAQLKKAPNARVTCDQQRASYISMAMFFTLLGLGALGWPRARRNAVTTEPAAETAA